jgi:hypothetical protein
VRVFFALLLVPFTCVFPYIAEINNPNENVRVYATMEIVEEHTFRIDTMASRYGWVNDMARMPDAKGDGGHLFSVKGPAVTYAGVPFYWAFYKLAPLFGHKVPKNEDTSTVKAWWLRSSTLVVRFFVVQLPCFGFLVWLERWLRKITPDTPLRLSAVAAMGLGTNYLAYSLMYCSHSLAAISTFVAFAMTTDDVARPDGERKTSRAFVVGFLAGLSTMLDYQVLVVSVGLTLYALCVYFRSFRRVLALAAGGTIDVLALMFYQWRCFRNPFTPGHKYAENQGFAEWHKQGLYGISKPSWAVLRDVSFSRTFGFFTTSRFMGLALLAIPVVIFVGWRDPSKRPRRIATVVWFLTMLALWLAISGAVNWRGGWAVGPRFFVAAPPFFTFGAVCALDHFARRGEGARAFARGLTGGLAVAGLCTLGLVSLVYNSLPESIERPLAEFAYPLARAGFVPHHLAELVGWKTPTFFFIAFGCGAGATLVAALWPSGERRWALALRAGVAALIFAACMYAEFRGVTYGVPGDVSGTRAFFVSVWEPPHRDYLTQLRAQAAVDPKKPCLWHKLADKEVILGMFDEAGKDHARAKVPASSCK